MTLNFYLNVALSNPNKLLHLIIFYVASSNFHHVNKLKWSKIYIYHESWMGAHTNNPIF